MTRCDLHGKKITLAAGWRMKGGARIDVKEQCGGLCSEMTSSALSLAGCKGKEKKGEITSSYSNIYFY